MPLDVGVGSPGLGPEVPSPELATSRAGAWEISEGPGGSRTRSGPLDWLRHDHVVNIVDYGYLVKQMNVKPSYLRMDASCGSN